MLFARNAWAERPAHRRTWLHGIPPKKTVRASRVPRNVKIKFKIKFKHRKTKNKKSKIKFQRPRL